MPVKLKVDLAGNDHPEGKEDKAMRYTRPQILTTVNATSSILGVDGTAKLHNHIDSSTMTATTAAYEADE